jgi:hypothetical protein
MADAVLEGKAILEERSKGAADETAEEKPTVEAAAPQGDMA